MTSGGGRIDLARATTPLVFAAPSSASFGLLKPRTQQDDLHLAERRRRRGGRVDGRPHARAGLAADRARVGHGAREARRHRDRRARARRRATEPASSRCASGPRRARSRTGCTSSARSSARRRRCCARPGRTAATLRRGSANVSTYRYPEGLTPISAARAGAGLRRPPDEDRGQLRRPRRLPAPRQVTPRVVRDGRREPADRATSGCPATSIRTASRSAHASRSPARSCRAAASTTSCSTHRAAGRPASSRSGSGSTTSRRRP